MDNTNVAASVNNKNSAVDENHKEFKNMTLEERIQHATNFILNFYKGSEEFYTYLWCKSVEHRNGITIPFKCGDHTEIAKAVHRALKLNERKYNIYFGVNLGSEPTDEHHRYTKANKGITRQVAIYADIDFAVDGHHKQRITKNLVNPTQLADSFETAQKFLPIEPSIVVHSGGGIQAYWLLDKPIDITDDEARNAAANRNQQFIAVIRHCANGYDGIDSVGDLERILRLPYSYNCKVINEPKPCTILSDDGASVNVAVVDTIIKKTFNHVTIIENPANVSPATTTFKNKNFSQTTNNLSALEKDIALAALDAIPTKDTAANGGNDWLAINTACKNLGMDAQIDEWNKRDLEHYDEMQNKRRYDSLKDSSFGIHTLIGIAKKYGFSVKDFKRQWFKDHRNIDSDSTTANFSAKETILSTPADVVLPSGYTLDANAIYKCGKDKKGEEFETFLTSTPMIVSKVFTDVDTGKESVEVAVYNDATHKWKFVQLAASAIGDPKQVMLLADDGVDVWQGTAKNLAEYLTRLKNLRANYDRIPRWQLHNRTGWTDDGTNFILPNRTVDGHTLKDSAVDKKAFTTKGDYGAWKKYIAGLIRAINNDWHGGAFLLTFGAALAAPLLRPCNVRSQQILLRGPTAKGKTSILKLALSIYGTPEKLKHTFDATRTALAKISEKYNDLPVMVDELQSADQKLLDDIDKLVYQKANESSRVRCEKNGDLQARTNDIKNFSLYSGEMPALHENSNGGAYNRLLQLHDLPPLPQNINPRDVHNFVDDNHGYFGADWIDYITKHKADIVKNYADAFKLVKEKIFDGGNRSDSWISTFAVILHALNYALPMIDSTITQKKIFEVFTMAFREITPSIPTIDNTANGTRALDRLQEYFTANAARFQYVDKDYSVDDTQHAPFDGFDGVIFNNGMVGFYCYKFSDVLKGKLGYPSAAAILDDFANKGLLQNDSYPYKTRFSLADSTGKKRANLYIFGSGVFTQR